jgi:hypothetical protein
MKWYGKPSGDGFLCEKCGLGRNETVTLLYLVPWPSTLTYRVKTPRFEMLIIHTPGQTHHSRSMLLCASFTLSQVSEHLSGSSVINLCSYHQEMKLL